MTIILDSNFLNPNQINELPCFTADRWLEKIDETVIITQCCQDSDNTSLVIIDFVLVGAFYFTPVCHILSVDGDTSFETNSIVAPLAIGHFKNPNIPINTNCSTFHGQLVFDFGSVIPTYLTATNITFKLTMIGQIPQSYGVTFPNQSPYDEYEWQKGILPSPIGITYLNGNYNIVFEYKGNKDCSCNIQCVVPSGVSNNIQFCPDQKQSVVMYYGDLNSDPTSLLIQLSDSVGNISVLEIQPLMGVSPSAPIVVHKNEPSLVEITLNPKSIGGVDIEYLQYQVLKYVGSANNYIVWKDWSSNNKLSFIDTDVKSNKTYGYAVKYKGKFNDTSELSSWSVITV